MNFDASEPAGELIALCDRLIDGTLTNEEHARLEAMVIGDADLRRLYVEYLQLHSHLSHHPGLSESAGTLRSVSLPVSKGTQPHRSGWLLKAAAAIALASGVATGTWAFAKRSTSIAVLSEVEGARWGNSTLPTEPGSSLPAGRLRLAEGLATLRFKSGAEVTLEGPAELELINGMLCRLHRGSIVAHVPEPAKGFTVLTDQAKLIDHGTDFGISTDASGNASVHVMNGEVELQHNNGGEPLRLLSHQMSSITPDKLQPAAGIEMEPSSQRDTEASPFTHKITTANGRGAATYVTSPNTPYHYSDSLLLLKNSGGKTFLRKAALRFDLNSIEMPDTIESANLTLHFDATGYGFAALGGDAHFVVYAVTDDALDEWPSDQLEWKDLPAFNPDPGRVDESKAVKVGEFTMPRGILRGPFSIEGPAFIERLQNDGNRLLTLIVVRENPLNQSSGVVHGFAGNRHPNLPPPTIRLR